MAPPKWAGIIINLIGAVWSLGMAIWMASFNRPALLLACAAALVLAALMLFMAVDIVRIGRK